MIRQRNISADILLQFLSGLPLMLVPAWSAAQKWEGLADTPQMGWNSWNKFGQNISEKLIREQADAMVAEGLVEAGYIYLNMDDCWHGERDADGFVCRAPCLSWNRRHPPPYR